jgi:hypothetical protein
LTKRGFQFILLKGGVMIQLYFLSILCNGLTGYILIRNDSGDDGLIETSMRFSARNSTFRLGLGIVSAVTGLLKLLSPVSDNWPVLGDLIPGLAGIAAGFMLIFGYYREHASDVAFSGEGKMDHIGDSVLKFQKGAGFALLFLALLHFLFPRAILL